MLLLAPFGMLKERLVHSIANITHAEREALATLFDQPHGAFKRSKATIDDTYFGYPVTVMRQVDLSDAYNVGLGWEELIVPADDRVRRVSDSSPGIDAAVRSHPTWAIVNASDLVPIFASEQRRTPVDEARLLKKLLVKLLPAVTLNGESVSLEQVLPWGYTHFNGALLPIIHRDYQWSSFGDVAGFQAWCLVRNRDEHGNLVLIDHPEAPTEHKHPVYFAWADSFDERVRRNKTSSTSGPPSEPTQHEGQLLKLNHITSELHERYDTWKDAPLKFEYPRMQPGECIVMHRAQLHASDPRKPIRATSKPSDRLAFTIRFIVRRTPASPLPIWLGNGYAKRFVLESERKGRCRLHPKLTGWCTMHQHHLPFHSFL